MATWLPDGPVYQLMACRPPCSTPTAEPTSSRETASITDGTMTQTPLMWPIPGSPGTRANGGLGASKNKSYIQHGNEKHSLLLHAVCYNTGKLMNMDISVQF